MVIGHFYFLNKTNTLNSRGSRQINGFPWGCLPCCQKHGEIIFFRQRKIVQGFLLSWRRSQPTNTNLITTQETDIQVDKLHMISLKFVKIVRQMWCCKSINVPLEVMVSHTVQIGEVSTAPPPSISQLLKTLTLLQFAKPALKTPERGEGGGGVILVIIIYVTWSSSLWILMICDAFLKWKKIYSRLKTGD